MQIILQGRVNDKGTFITNDNPKFHEFLRLHKNHIAIMKVEVYVPNTVKVMAGYYYGKLVPDIQQIFFETGDPKTTEDVDHFIQAQSKILPQQINSQGSQSELPQLRDLPYHKWKQFIDEVVRMQAEMLNYVIVN